MSARGRRIAHLCTVFFGVAALAAAGWAVGSAILTGAHRTHTAAEASADELLANATQYFNHGRFSQAEELARRVLERRPESADAHLLMAEILVGLGRFQDACAHAEAAVRLAPDEENNLFFAGVVASKAGRWEEACAYHRRAARISPGAAKHPLYTATALLQLDRLDEAREQALHARRLDGSSAEACLVLAQVADRQGQTQAALEWLDEALARLDPTAPHRQDYVLYKAQLLRRSGRADQAINLLTGLPPAQQQEERVAAELAQSHLVQGEPGKAAAVWAELFALQPRNPRFAAEAGLCVARAGDTRQARRYLSYAQALDPRHPAVRSLREAIENTDP